MEVCDGAAVLVVLEGVGIIVKTIRKYRGNDKVVSMSKKTPEDTIILVEYMVYAGYIIIIRFGRRVAGPEQPASRVRRGIV